MQTLKRDLQCGIIPLNLEHKRRNLGQALWGQTLDFCYDLVRFHDRNVICIP